MIINRISSGGYPGDGGVSVSVSVTGATGGQLYLVGTPQVPSFSAIVVQSHVIGVIRQGRISCNYQEGQYLQVSIPVCFSLKQKSQLILCESCVVRIIQLSNFSRIQKRWYEKEKRETKIGPCKFSRVTRSVITVMLDKCQLLGFSDNGQRCNWEPDIVFTLTNHL